MLLIYDNGLQFYNFINFTTYYDIVRDRVWFENLPIGREMLRQIWARA